MNKANQRKAQNYFIKRDLQGRLIWQAFLLGLLCIVVFCIIFSFVSAEHLSISYDGRQVQVESLPVVLAKEVLRNNWILLLAFSLIIAVGTVILSHRIAGPIYHFEAVTGNMCQRNLDQLITLRPRDDAAELAESLNFFNRMLSEDIQSLQRQSEQIKVALETDKLAEAVTANQEMNKILSSYQLVKRQENS